MDSIDVSNRWRGGLVEEMRLEITGPLPDPSDLERPADGGQLRARLQAGETVSGDPFPPGVAFNRYGRSILRGMFGQPFVEALWAAPPGQWSGPIESLNGWHFVRPTERLAATLLPFEAVRGRARGQRAALIPLYAPGYAPASLATFHARHRQVRHRRTRTGDGVVRPAIGG